MSKTTRRTFLAAGAAIAAAPLISSAASAAARTTPAVPLSWLDGHAPLLPSGVAWGVPWLRGSVARDRTISVRDAGGRAIPAQTWPLAFWPDGSIKWTAVAIAADSGTNGLTVTAGSGASPAPAMPVRVQDTAQFVEITTGPLRARINRSGDVVIATLAVDGREVARDGRLILTREDRSAWDSARTVRQEDFTGRVTKVTVEQSGPVRAVVRIDGVHANGSRQWLPFCVRLYFTAGQTAVRMVHSFVFDGDQQTDFIKGIGLSFTVPFREELQNRHVRFATDADHVFAEPVMMAPGYRPNTVQHAADMQAAQIAGKRIPNLADLPARDKANFETVAVWDDYGLTQLAPDSFEITKRTNAQSSPLHITNGNRARGLAFLGDVSGGLAVGVKRFWQKYPSAFEIDKASAPAGELKVWFWSPEAPAMDLRHYDTKGHGLTVSYEDYQPGFSTPEGVANTAELTLWPSADTPDAATLDAMAKTASNPPLLICPPAHYYDTHTLGVWSLPGRAIPGLSDAEAGAADTQLDRAFAFFNGEVERRRWHGFWDFGDFRRTYDPIRHEWMYDIGGHGWNETELMPNAWLWFAFLRSGRADIFRLAEDMHRNTTEVIIHHTGRFAGLGSRHNVNHWGDGAKEARINEAFLKRFYYYLTTDERTGDLLREPLNTVEASLAAYPPLREVNPRTDVKPAFIRFGPDWLALASNWMAEWERTNDPRWRDYILTGMKDIGAMPDAFVERAAFRFDPVTKHLSDVGAPNQKPSHFMYVFGGDHIALELMQLIDCPEFVAAWNRLAEKFARTTPGSVYFQTRITAYAAAATGDAGLEASALQLYRDELKFKGGDHFPAQPVAVTGPGVTSDVLEVPSNSSFTPAIAVPEVAQWAINLISAPEFLRHYRAGQPAPVKEIVS